VAVVGKLTDPVYGNWASRGTFDLSTGQLRAHATCPDVQVSAGLFGLFGAKIDNFRESCNITGTMSAELNLYGRIGGHEPLNYQLVLDPRNVRIAIPPIPEAIHDLTGRIEITPDQVRIHGLAGDLANGQVVATGNLLRTQPDRLTLSVDVRHLDVGRLVRAAPDTTEIQALLQPAESLSGKFQVQGSRDPDTWTGTFDGSLQLRKPADAHSIPLNLSLSKGFLIIDQFKWAWDGGQLHLSAQIPVRSNQDIQGTVRIERVALESVCRLMAPQAPELSGVVDGELAFRVPVELSADVRAWEMSGPARVQSLRCRAAEFDSLAGSVAIRRGVIRIEDATAAAAHKVFTGDLSLSLFEPYELSANYRLRPIEMRDWQQQEQPARSDKREQVRGQLELTGTLTVGLDSNAISVRGKGAVYGLGIGVVDLGDTRFGYEWSNGKTRLSNIDLTVYGGRVRGSARLQASATDTGTAGEPARSAAAEGTTEFTMLGTFEDMDLSRLVGAVSFQDIDLHGLASGEFQLRLMPDAADPVKTLRVTGHGASKRLTVGGMPAEASLEFDYDGTTFTVSSLAATMPAGRVSGSARIELSARERSITAELQSANLNLFKLAASLPTAAPLPLLSGTMAGQVSLQIDLASGDLVGHGAGRIQSLSVPDIPLIHSVLARRFEIRNGKIVVPEYHASLWGGTSTGSCQINLRPDSEKCVEIAISRLEQVELSQLAAAWPPAAGSPSGKLSGSGTLSVVARGSRQAVFAMGDFTAESAIYAGLPVGRVVGSIEAYDAATHDLVSGKVVPKQKVPTELPTDQRYVIKVRDARPARGTLQGTVLVGVSGLLTYDASLRFGGLDLATVVQKLFASRHNVTGVLSGEMRLVGSERGTSDARGEMWFRVDGGNLWRFPVLAVFVRESSRVLNRLLNLNLAERGAQTAVARRVTLENEVLRVHEFWIAGDFGRLFGEGTVGLDSRIDLDFVGNFDTGLPKGVPLLGQLNGAINFLQQRLVKFHLTGTLSDPVAVPVPLQDLTEPAERFFRGVLSGTLFEEPTRPRSPMR
jgi:hypothetical protein